MINAFGWIYTYLVSLYLVLRLRTSQMKTRSYLCPQNALPRMDEENTKIHYNNQKLPNLVKKGGHIYVHGMP